MEPSGPREPESPPPAPGAETDGTRPYEPPAVAWEEPFESLAATSCGFANPFEQNCLARPQV